MKQVLRTRCLLELFLLGTLLIVFNPVYGQEELRTWKSEGLKSRVKQITTYFVQWPKSQDSLIWRGATIGVRIDFDSLGHATGYAASDPQESDTYQTYRYDSLSRMKVVTDRLVQIKGDSIYLISGKIYGIPDSGESFYSYGVDTVGRMMELRYFTGTDSFTIRKTCFIYDSMGRLIADSTWRGSQGLAEYTVYTYSAMGLSKREKYSLISNYAPMLTDMDEYDSAGMLIRHTWYGCCTSPGYHQATFKGDREETMIIQVESYKSEGRYEYQDDAQGNWIYLRYFQRKIGTQEWRLFMVEKRVIKYW